MARTAPRTSAERVTAAVELNATALLRFFSRRVEQPEDAADLLGETLLAVWRRARSIPGDDAGARMWMYGIANNVLANHRRSRVRQFALADKLRSDLAHRVGGGDGQAGGAEADLLEHVRGLIADLDPRERDLVSLVHWEGFSIIEAAKILQLNPSTARTRYSRARARLRDALRESGDVG
ncbi:RNA polymerase sigma factor [Homoserinimonas sp. A447]